MKEQINLATLFTTPWQYAVVLFYNYTFIENPTELMKSQRESLERNNLKGRVIVAHEGINSIAGGLKEDVYEYCKELVSDSRFANTHFKFSEGGPAVFPRISVKVRPEIVSLHLGDEDFHPSEITGKKLSPKELHEMYENKEDFVVVDMRNNYEHEVGHFKDSILPPLSNFRDLKGSVESIAHLKNKKVITVCTGGVRCEKASGYLCKQGFKDVYQLDGGMVSYMEQFPGQNFNGGMFTFDKREVIDYSGGHQIISKCISCSTPCERVLQCLNKTHNHKFVGCIECFLDDALDGYCTKDCMIPTGIKASTEKTHA